MITYYHLIGKIHNNTKVNYSSISKKEKFEMFVNNNEEINNEIENIEILKKSLPLSDINLRK